MKIGIVGYYGHGNLGDELNLAEMIKLINRQYPDAEVTVFSDSVPIIWEKPKYNLVANFKIADLNKMDLLIIGGGGIIYLGANYFKFYSDLKVPFIISRVGIDDRTVNHSEVEGLRGFVNKAEDFTVRSFSDVKLAQQHFGITPKMVHEAIWNYEAAEFKYNTSPNIIVDINIYGDEWSKDVLDALHNLEIAHQIWVMSAQPTATDLYYSIKATPHSRKIIPDVIGLDGKAATIAAADIVITSRLHVGVLSVSHGKKTIMPKCLPKMKAFVEEFQGLKTISDEITADKICQLLQTQTDIDYLSSIKDSSRMDLIP